MDRRSEDYDATKRQILDAVTTVVADSGLDALTVQAVAAQADVAIRTVYNHFDNRDGLIAAALGSLAESTRASVRAISVSDDEPREQVLAFVDAYLRTYEAQGDALRVLMGAATTVDVVSEVVQEVRKWRRDQLRSMLQRAQGDGRLQLQLADAVNIAYLATAYSTYASLTTDVGLSPSKARALTRNLLDRSIFAE
jgi:AcrR family transcriptional regulator